MSPTVIHHSADYDGVFCREIARKFLPDAKLIGWDFANKPLELSAITPGKVYVLDLPVDAVFGYKFPKDLPPAGLPSNFDGREITWIDHHKSAIDSHPTYIPGYRIDGVAACRLAWQYFLQRFPFGGPECHILNLPAKQDYIDRKVTEPLSVRLAGEYDIWDHRGDGDLEFQFGLDCLVPIQWDKLLSTGEPDAEGEYIADILRYGRAAMQCYKKRDGDIMRERSFLVDWEGLKFLALTTARCNSQTFAARDVAETGHDALMAFFYNGKRWTVSLYHAAHRKDLDLSAIAVKYGGGGHRGACGFTIDKLPFL
jgi:hypothetical protein